MIERAPISNSSSVVSSGYNPITKTLHVEFKSGKVGEYTDVPAETAEARYRVTAEQSKGQIFTGGWKTK